MRARRQATTGFRFASILLLVSLASVGYSQSPSEEPIAGNEEHRFVEMGQLAKVRTRTGNGVSYVLLDQHGEVISSLRPAAGVELESHLGEEVGITATTLVAGDTPILLAENVTTFGEARQLAGVESPGPITLTSHEQALAVNGPLTSSVMTSSPTGFVSGDRVGPLLPTPAQSTIQPHMEPSVANAPMISGDYYPSVVGSAYGCDCDTCRGTGVANPSCSTCCGLPGRFWIRGENLIWWTKGMDTPALLVSSPENTIQRDAGVLGVPGNVTLFGGTDILDGSRSGGRFRIGKWCDQCNWVGFETDVFFLDDESASYRDSDVGNQIIGRPFTDSAQGNSSELIDFPGLVAGTVAIDAETSLWSINPRLRVNLSCESFPSGTRRNPCAMGGYRMDMLVGYRYMRLDDDLSIREQLMAPTAGANGQIPLIPRFDDVTFFDIRDSFSTSNEFHGADIGLSWEGYRGRWSLELLGKVGIGSTSQQVDIRGSTTRVANGNTFNDEGGLLALGTNIGSYSRNEFTVLPEVGATLGYAMTPRMRFLVGYSFLYWSEVVRAGDQIDTTINTDFLPDPQPTTGPNRPAFDFVDTSFWAQGLNLGLDYRW